MGRRFIENSCEAVSAVQLVLPHRCLSEDFGQLTPGSTPLQIHLPQAIACVM
jgi:hypothetical protein